MEISQRYKKLNKLVNTCRSTTLVPQLAFCYIKCVRAHVLSLCSPVWLSASLDCRSTRLLCPWDSPGKNTRVGCHVLLQGIFPSGLLCLLHWQVDSLLLVPPGKPLYKTHLVVNPLICGHLGFLWMRQANKCIGLLWNPSFFFFCLELLCDYI